MRLALAEAEKAGAPMPSVDVVRDRLITGIARGYGDLDWTALGLVAAEEAGLQGESSAQRQLREKKPTSKRKDPCHDFADQI